jgi:hypothetical protein
VTALEELFAKAGHPVPAALGNWDDRVYDWCDEYSARCSGAEISEIVLDLAAYLFDHIAERVVLAYAVSIPQLFHRDASRIRGFPNVNVSVRAELGERAFVADKGHFLGHASGGILDINLFPQRRELNRGWSPEGKRYRSMERYVADHAGTFFFHRPIYDDDSWIPEKLEYGVLRDDGFWWTEVFRNK